MKTPDDVYRLFMFVLWMQIAVCALIALQIVVKIVIFGRVVRAENRVGRMLNMMEKHHKVTDSVADTVTSVMTGEVRKAAEDIKSEVPRTTIDMIRTREGEK